MSPSGKPPPSVQDLLSARSRGEIKQWGAFLDGDGRDLRVALVAAARGAGVALSEADLELDGRRLLRRCLARDEEAQVRKNPIRIDESFICAHCGVAVPAGGRRPRDHCHQCLHSLHVDNVPGDRAAGCGGALVPFTAENSPKGWMILYRCARCQTERRNRFLDDVIPPDSPARLRDLLRP